MNRQTFQYKKYQGGTYLRVMMQDTTTKIIFKDKTEAAHYVSREHSQYKYSILDMLPNLTLYSQDKYEFIMCYPEINACNHWSQTKSPLDYKEKSSQEDIDAIGFRSLDNRFAGFKGLMLSSGSEALLDGDASNVEYWGYAAGVVSNYHDYHIPGVTFNGVGYFLFQSFTLYIRVPNLALTCQSPFHCFVHIFFIFLLFCKQ